MTTPPVRLTSLSHGAGCACKLGFAELGQVLRHLPSIVNPDVLVDAASRDDAAVYRLSDDRALIATVDFFTPIVDDARSWGAIAAANAISDVYAMGGTPLFSLNLVGWPRGKLPWELLGEVIAGAADVAARAHCLMLGGHSVDDPEPKFGMCVIGDAHPDRLLTNSAARPGDRLVLTKPLGTGILTTAVKRDVIDAATIAPAIESMVTLNDGAMRAALASGVKAATDVTGFGLLGHLGNILNSSQVGATLYFDAMPLLPSALDLAGRGVIPGGTERNLAAAASVVWDDTLTAAERYLMVDAQTSGGLLLAVAPARLDHLLTRLKEEKTLAAAVIGTFTGKESGVRVEKVRQWGAGEQAGKS
ncbi:MAG: selenide, water dikinase SelD [Gemmatimonadota bacterium]